MGKSHTIRAHRQLPRKDQVVLLGGGTANKSAEAQFVEKLQNDEGFAVRLGVAMKRARADFARAYPHETRESFIPNEELKKRGYVELAKANELMKLAGS